MKIDINNVGPIQSLSIPIPDGGGIVCLKGRNGAGKTTALNAAARLLGGESTVEARYGSPGGSVDGLGARLTVGTRQVRGTGELVVSCLEGADPSTFVDPGVDDPDRADARRIAELCRLTGAKPDFELFAGVGDLSVAELKRVASPKTFDAPGLPELAVALRRDLQAAARTVEQERDSVHGAAQALLSASEGVELTGDEPMSQYDEQLERAIQDRSALLTRRAEVDSRLAAASKARGQLESARAAYDGQSVVDAQATLQSANNRIDELKRELQAAQAAAQGAHSALQRAKDHERNMSLWETSLADAEGLEPVSPEAVAAADQAVAVARQRKDASVLIADKRKKRRDAEAKLSRSSELSARAAALRAAADGCEGVVTAQIARVAPAGLRVDNGRLVLDRDGKTETFAKLSHGEKWKLALDIAIDAMPATDALKVLVVRQEAFEGLDTANRAALAEHAKERRCVILTAEATEGEVVAEAFQIREPALPEVA